MDDDSDCMIIDAPSGDDDQQEDWEEAQEADGSSSSAFLNECLTRIRTRKLKLDRIIGFAQGGDQPVAVVKWRGIKRVEKVPYQVLRHFYRQALIEYLLTKVKRR